MKTKLLSKILAVGLAIGLVFALGAAVIPAGEAQADEMEWGEVNTPSWEDNVIAPGTDIFDYAVGPDGETIYATGAITSANVEDESIHGLTGGFEIDTGEVTITRISDYAAEIEGWLEGDSCYLMGDFTIFTAMDISGVSAAAITGEITVDPYTLCYDEDDRAEFSGMLYDDGGMFTDNFYFEITDGELDVQDWILDGYVNWVQYDEPGGEEIDSGTGFELMGIFTQPRVWKSTDAGVTWEDITATVQDAVNLPGPFFMLSYGGIAVAPDDENWLALGGLIFDPEFLMEYGPPHVFRPAVVASEDGGDEFSFAGYMEDGSEDSYLAFLYDIDVSPEVDNIHNIAVAGIATNAGHDDILWGSVYRLEAGTWLSGAWEDTAFYDGWDDWDESGEDWDDRPIYSIAVVDVEFSPNFDMDDTIVCMTSNLDFTNGVEPLPYLQEGIWESGGAWNGKAGFSDAVQITDEGNDLYTLPGIKSMGTALPDDFDGTDPGANNIYLYVDAFDTVTEVVGGYVFICEDGALTGRCGPSGDPLLASIDVYGDADTCKAMVGVYCDWDNGLDEDWGPERFDCCQGVAVYHTVELDDCCPEWEAACKDPSGPYMAVVQYSPDGEKAFAATTGAMDIVWSAIWWAVTEGPIDIFNYIDDESRIWGGYCDESAFSVSLDDGVSFNQIGLIDTDIDHLSDVAVCPDCSVIYLSTVNEMEDWGPYYDGYCDVGQVCECDSIWRSYDNGDTWERIYHGDWLFKEYIEDDTNLLLRLPCDELEECCTIYMGIQGTQELYYSRDCGQCWNKAVNQKLTIEDFAVESENIVYILDDEGYVSTSTQYGRRPSDGVDTGVGSGHSITSCCKEGFVMVGGNGDEPVAWSEDSGETWELTDDLPGDSDGGVHVACDPICDNIIYAAVADSDAGVGLIYRSDITDGSWTDMNAMPADYDGIAIGRSDGTLYAVTDSIRVDSDEECLCERFDEDGDEEYSGVARNLTPCETDCCGTEDWDYLIAGIEEDEEDFDIGPSALKICGCTSIDTNSILWAIDTNHYEVSDASEGTLWSYEDCAAKRGIVLTSPEDGAIVSCDVCGDCVSAALTFEWERMCLACSYDIEIMDEDGNVIAAIEELEISGDPPSLYWDGEDCPNDCAIGCQSPLECGRTYTWHVREANTETDECVHSPWSETWSFTIEASSANAVKLIAPEQGAVVAQRTGVGFSWSSVYDATTYSFVLSASPDLSGALASADVPGTAYAYSGTLDYETTYYWQVTAWKDGTMLSQSDVGTFAVAAEEIIPEPAQPTPPPEVNIPPVQNVTPTWMYVVFAIGIALIVVVIVLIVRSRRPS
ncbi:MAG: hypothetical protein PHI12_01925 [Dehalococcoidales bacterium]|nr:hypothetical protein [Dehalococcoidales bacterium]